MARLIMSRHVSLLSFSAFRSFFPCLSQISFCVRCIPPCMSIPPRHPPTCHLIVSTPSRHFRLLPSIHLPYAVTYISPSSSMHAFPTYPRLPSSDLVATRSSPLLSLRIPPLFPAPPFLRSSIHCTSPSSVVHITTYIHPYLLPSYPRPLYCRSRPYPSLMLSPCAVR
ncbi:hypothetical protein B0H11DRAFT_2130164 [Mycena galericulata]|nr:hypothetical protein B0H11DRAFT_2130164 [Mycena galericulata]